MEQTSQKRSVFGLVSLIIGILVLISMFVCIFSAVVLHLSTPGGILQASNNAIEFQNIGLLCIGLLSLVGMGFSIRGFFENSRKKVFPVLGFIFSSVVLAGLILMMVMKAQSNVQTIILHSKSMKPNYQPNQRVLIEKISVSEIKQGDVILCEITEGNPGIKRVIALPGQTIAIQWGVVYINGSPLVENYQVIPDTGYNHNIAEQKLTAHQYFVLGDNRPESADSRQVGPIDEKQILGRVIP